MTGSSTKVGDRMGFATASRLGKMSDDALLEYLREVAGELDTVNARQKALWASRLDAYQAGRSRDPAITHRRLAAAAGVSEVAIITKLKQLAERANGAV